MILKANYFKKLETKTVNSDMEVLALGCSRATYHIGYAFAAAVAAQRFQTWTSQEFSLSHISMLLEQGAFLMIFIKKRPGVLA